VHSQTSKLLPNTMVCHCSTTNLGTFLRSIAQIELRQAFPYVTAHNSAFSIRRISTCTPLSSQHLLTSKQPATYSPISLSVDDDSMPLQQVPGIDPSISKDPRKWPNTPRSSGTSRRTGVLEKDSKRQHVTFKIDSEDGANGPIGSSSVWNRRSQKMKAKRPENSMQKFSNSKSSELGALLEINYNTIEALATDSRQDMSQPPVKKGFALHYSSPPKDGVSEEYREAKARSIKLRDNGNLSPKWTADEDDSYTSSRREPWQLQKAALKDKFQDGWNPRKKLSPDALAGIRAIHAQFPEEYTTSVLADKFQVSPEAIRRILKSRWAPKEDEELERQQRWFSRGQQVWTRYAELGLKPPMKWRELGITREPRPKPKKSPKEKGYGGDDMI
jgi:hypothetical protein